MTPVSAAVMLGHGEGHLGCYSTGMIASESSAMSFFNDSKSPSTITWACVPSVEEGTHYFLKTIVPSRKATRDYLGSEAKDEKA
jgi:hypothetical protein